MNDILHLKKNIWFQHNELIHSLKTLENSASVYVSNGKFTSKESSFQMTSFEKAHFHRTKPLDVSRVNYKFTIANKGTFSAFLSIQLNLLEIDLKFTELIDMPK